MTRFCGYCGNKLKQQNGKGAPKARCWIWIPLAVVLAAGAAGIVFGIRWNSSGARLERALEKEDYECRDCRGNFIFVKPKHSAREVANRLETEKKVLVHPYGNELLKDCLRVSVGSKEAMELFLEAFLEVDRQ